MVLMLIDPPYCAAIPIEDWNAVKLGNQAAIERVRASLQDVDLYFHALSIPDRTVYELVSVTTLMDLGIVKSIKLNCMR